MNKKGFTLVEILSVIILLGLVIGIAVPGVMRAQTKAKEKTLATKVKNIEKAAILYGQNNREKIILNLNDEKYASVYNSFDEQIKNLCDGKEDCYYYFQDDKENTVITVKDLILGKYIKADDSSGNILNPTDETKTLNDCSIQIYKKYGKIYAVYLNKDSEKDNDNTQCWTGK